MIYTLNQTALSAGYSGNVAYDSENSLFEEWAGRTITSADFSIFSIHKDDGYIGAGVGLAIKWQGGVIRINPEDITTKAFGYTRDDLKSYFGHKYGGDSFDLGYIRESEGRFFYGQNEALEVFKINEAGNGVELYGTQSFIDQRNEILNGGN